MIAKDQGLNLPSTFVFNLRSCEIIAMFMPGSVVRSA